MKGRLLVKLNVQERALSALCAVTFFVFASFLFDGFTHVFPAYADALTRTPALSWFSQPSLMIAGLLVAMMVGKLAAASASTHMAARAMTGWPDAASR